MQRSVVVDLEREDSCVVDESSGMLDRMDLRNAMLRHERVFRCQVLELHRLYWTQMNLMNGVDIGSYGNCSRPSPPVFSPSRGKEVQNMAHLMHRPLMNGQTVDARDSAMDVSLGLRPDLWRTFDIRCSDAHIPADGSASNGITFERSELESNLGVSKDDDDRNRSTLKSFSCEQGSLRPPPEVINLEDPPQMEIRKEHMFVSPLAMKTSIPWHEMKDRFVLRGLSNNNFCGKSEKYIIDTHSKSLRFPGQEIDSAKSGRFINTSQPQPTQMEAPFDLNVAQPEDPPVTVDNTCVGFTLSGGSFDNRHIVKDNACKREVKEIHSKNEANDFLISGVGGSSFRQTSLIGGVSSRHDSNSMVINETMKSSPRSSLELNRVIPREHSTEFAEGMQPSSYGSSLTSSNSYNLRIVNADRYAENQVSGSESKKSELKFLSLFGTSISPSIPVRVLEGKQLEHENSDEDTLSSKIQQLNESNLFRQQQVLPEKLCAGVNSKSVIDLNSYSAECHNVKDVFPETSQIEKLETAVISTHSALESPNSKTHGYICHEGQYCGHDALQDGDLLTRKKREVEEMDDAVLMAAQCLNLMSSKRPKFKELQTSGLSADEMSDQPQCSSDSLELIVLSLPENEEGECSMPVKPLEEETSKKTASRFNSRRGRQLRDFQRDILPGIVSLSRHEICEDMHAFTEISRLHRINTKEKSGNIYKQNWPNTTRKRRPRCH